MEKIGVTKKEGAILESGLLIQNIEIRPVHRTKQDIQDWRIAHQHAEAITGNRIDLYDLYNDALLDGFLTRLVAIRILGVTKNRLKYVDSQLKEIPVKNNVIDLLQFKLLREAIQNCKAWGIGVFELINDNGKFRFFDVPKKHINPKEGKILYNQYGGAGIDYKVPPYNRTVIQIGRHDDLGYLLSAVAYVLYKRGAIADWANYAQIFGMPFREARYDGFNEVVRIQLEKALEQAASAAWAVLPKDAEFTLHEAKGASGSNELFSTLRKAMNEEMTVLILGATETTVTSSSSGYAQSKTHKETVDEQQHNDMQDELATLNSLVLPVLIDIGLLPAGGHLIYENSINLNTAEKQIEVAGKVVELGLDLNDNQIYEIAGLRKPANYEVEKKKLSAEIRRQKGFANLALQQPKTQEENAMLQLFKKWLKQI